MTATVTAEGFTRPAGRRSAAAVLSAALLSAAAVAQPPAPPAAAPPAGANTPAAPAPSADEVKARELFAKGQADEALKLLTQAVKANPALVPARVTMARWLLEGNNGQQARMLLEQAAAEDEDHPDVYLTNASIAFAEGRITDALLNCDKALELASSTRWDPDRRKRVQRDARSGLAAAAEARRNWRAAEADLAALLQSDPRNPQVRTRYGRVLFLMGQTDDAFRHLKQAVADDPRLDPAEVTVGTLWSQAGDNAQAEKWMGEAVKAHPKSAKVHRAYAGWLLDQGKTDPALAHLEEAAKIEPTARDTRALRGLAARYKKDYATAVAAFEDLLREYPSDAFVMGNLALSLAESGDATQRRRAVDLAELYQRQNARAADGPAVLGYALLKAGRVDDAERALGAAAQAAGGRIVPDTAYYLARLLNERGKFEDANRLLAGALESKAPFVYRSDAAALAAEIKPKLPPAKPEDKK